jgi:hypothetical protein
MDKQVVLHVKCPLCYHSLLDNEHYLNGKPAVKLNITTDEDRGVVWLCSIYDSYDKELSIDVPDKEVVSFFCPHCNKELTLAQACDICKAPMISMVIKAGGRVLVCSRNGCTNHHITFKEVGVELGKFYEEYGF